MRDVLWQTVLGEIEVMVSRASFETWFKNTALLSREADRLIVGVPNIFTKRQFEDKFNRLVMRILKKNGATVKAIDYQVRLTQAIPATQAPTPNLVAPVVPARTNGLSLNSRYLFESFIVGGSNELAYAAAQAIAREPGTKYNPFFVYGGVGLGKTHLIQAIGNEILHRHAGLKVEYVTSERFKNEFIASILRNTKTLSTKYRDVDVLIVDDMQFIAGKEKTQEEFFHTFNTLYQNNKQIIISSDKPPKAMPALEERLRSRFEWGMTTDIQPPDFETRMAIIAAKAARHNSKIPIAVAEFLANHIQANIRELEGALNKLLAHCEMRQLTPSLELVEQLVSPAETQQRQLSPRQVVERTARFFNISVDELTGPKRDRQIVEPRQVAMYLLRTELKLSFPQVAKQVGRLDHSTAIHSIGKIEKAVISQQHLRQKVLELKEKLYA